jgi:hypothetical protein
VKATIARGRESGESEVPRFPRNGERSGDYRRHAWRRRRRAAYPYGDFEQVHRCAVLSAESRAGQYKHHDIENAVAHLHGMIDALART